MIYFISKSHWVKLKIAHGNSNFAAAELLVDQQKVQVKGSKGALWKKIIISKQKWSNIYLIRQAFLTYSTCCLLRRVHSSGRSPVMFSSQAWKAMKRGPQHLQRRGICRPPRGIGFTTEETKRAMFCREPLIKTWRHSMKSENKHLYAWCQICNNCVTTMFFSTTSIQQSTSSRSSFFPNSNELLYKSMSFNHQHILKIIQNHRKKCTKKNIRKKNIQ